MKEEVLIKTLQSLDFRSSDGIFAAADDKNIPVNKIIHENAEAIVHRALRFLTKEVFYESINSMELDAHEKKVFEDVTFEEFKKIVSLLLIVDLFKLPYHGEEIKRKLELETELEELLTTNDAAQILKMKYKPPKTSIGWLAYYTFTAIISKEELEEIIEKMVDNNPENNSDEEVESRGYYQLQELDIEDWRIAARSVIKDIEPPEADIEEKPKVKPR